ncbi:hypothetical protein AcV5_008649 [Taiwanofungus camphoratus]|nr:hypothetical protein AcV5_008649 [Antrodia cinnamomea]
MNASYDDTTTEMENNLMFVGGNIITTVSTLTTFGWSMHSPYVAKFLPCLALIEFI